MNRRWRVPESPVVTLIKEDPHARVERLDTARGEVVRKTYTVPASVRWRTFLTTSRGRREHRNLTWLVEAGVPAVRPLDWGEERRAGCVTRSWVETEYLEGARDLRRLVREGKHVAMAGPRAWPRVLERVGALARACHRAGLVSTTMQTRNLLVAGEAEDPVVVLCDQPSLVRLPGSVWGGRLAAIDLYDLAFSASRRRDFSRAERYRLVLAYAGGDRRLSRRLWRRLSGRRRLAHKAAKGLVRGVLGRLLARPLAVWADARRARAG